MLTASNDEQNRVTDDGMTKALRDMTHDERMAALMRELKSPICVSTAIALVEQTRLELREAEEGLQIAMQLHPRAAMPTTPALLEKPAVKVEEAPSRKAGRRQRSGDTVADLIGHYHRDPRSPYKTLRHRTRVNYDGITRRILDVCGNEKLVNLTAANFQQFYDLWSGGPDGPKRAMAHAIVTVLRVIVNFGATVLEDDDCMRLAVVLHRMHLPGSRRTEREGLTMKHVEDFIKAAHEDQLPILALTQALQTECDELSQKDLIGEWVPMSDSAMADIMSARYGKWLHGIRWNEIDDNLILRHTTSRRGEPVEIDLKLKPSVLKQLELTFGSPVIRARLPKSGPIVIDPETGMPYLTHKFRRKWREIAEKADIPPHIKNMDSRRESNDARAAEITSAARN